jgi:hypothetical protein
VCYKYDSLKEIVTRLRQGEPVKLVKHGRPKKGEEKGDHITFKRGTTGVTYLLARLDRDHKEIRAAYDRDEGGLARPY